MLLTQSQTLRGWKYPTIQTEQVEVKAQKPWKVLPGAGK